MEQPTLTLEQSRWATAIAKLTMLTHTGKMRWVHVDTGSEDSQFLVSRSFTSSRYEAELSAQKFNLIVSRSAINENNPWSSLMGRPGLLPSSTRIKFRAFDESGRKVIELADLSILDTLASAVESEASSQEASVLAAIENA